MRPNVGMSRTAETIPFVTLPSSPSGLPITTTLSPSCGEVLSSGNGGFAGAGASIFNSAMSPSASTASTPLTGKTVPAGRVDFRAICAFEDVTVSDDAIGLDEETAAARKFLAPRVESLDRDCGRFNATNEFGKKILRLLDGTGN